jgi:phage N-6-adenine-methyltransferase
VSEPTQKPGRSKQDYGTPPVFLAAVKSLLDVKAFEHDLAADYTNTVAVSFYSTADNALVQPWPMAGWNWLNPPFADIGPWVQRAYESSIVGAHTAVLIPAAVGSNWWRDWVNQKADVLFLNGRLTFVGCTDPFPKDCALLLYSAAAYACHGSYDVWDWRREPSRAVHAEIPMHTRGNAIGCAPDLFSEVR